MNPNFDGHTYVAAHDKFRLTGQLARIMALMDDNVWRTLSEIAAVTNDGESSISAQLRNLRKERFGSHTVERRSRDRRDRGLYEYRIAA